MNDWLQWKPKLGDEVQNVLSAFVPKGSTGEIVTLPGGMSNTYRVRFVRNDKGGYRELNIEMHREEFGRLHDKR